MKKQKGFTHIIRLLFVLFAIVAMWMIAYAFFPDQVMLLFINKPHIISLISFTIIGLYIIFSPGRRR